MILSVADVCVADQRRRTLMPGKVVVELEAIKTMTDE